MSMEIKVNKDIGEYTEKVFFGLSLRQFVFSVLALGISVGIYFLMHSRLDTETLSWVCVLGAAPFGALAFIRVQGMTPEKFALVWLRSELLISRRLPYRGENRLYLSVTRLRKKEKDNTRLEDWRIWLKKVAVLRKTWISHFRKRRPTI